MIARLDAFIDRGYVPPVEPLQPEPDERLLWGRAPEPVGPPRRMGRRLLWAVYVLILLWNLWFLVRHYRSNPDALNAEFLLLLFAGMALAFYILPKGFGGVQRLSDGYVSPRVDALWLSDTRLAVIDHGARRSSHAYDVATLSHPRLDYDFGSLVVVVNVADSKLILRTSEARALHAALESLLLSPA